MNKQIEGRFERFLRCFVFIVVLYGLAFLYPYVMTWIFGIGNGGLIDRYNFNGYYERYMYENYLEIHGYFEKYMYEDYLEIQGFVINE